MTPQEFDQIRIELEDFTSFYDKWWTRLFLEHQEIFIVGQVINFPPEEMQLLTDKWKPLHELTKFLLLEMADGRIMKEVTELLKELYNDPAITPSPEIDAQEKLLFSVDFRAEYANLKKE